MDASIQERARKAKRVEVSIPTTMLRASGELQAMELRDLSFYGFKAQGDPLPAAGEYVKVDLPNIGAVRARVSWVRGGFFGGAFPTAVDVRKCLGKPELRRA
jgi:hypothetical protein